MDRQRKVQRYEGFCRKAICYRERGSVGQTVNVQFTKKNSRAKMWKAVLEGTDEGSGSSTAKTNSKINEKTAKIIEKTGKTNSKKAVSVIIL